MARKETPSVLASLTATYTDSEEEHDSDSQISTRPPISLPLSPGGNVNSQDGTSMSSSSDTRKKNPIGLGLVSYYHDDAIDEEIMDESRSDRSGSQNGISEVSEESDVMSNDEDQAVAQDKDVGNVRPRVRIPPEPQGKCSAESLARVAKLFEKKRQGMDMNQYIQSNKNFRNPSIYEKLIHLCHIDELGTNYPRDLYDPHFWGETSYYDELAKVQKTEMDKREKEKKERTKIEFQSGIIKKSHVSASSTQAEIDSKKKSKWDQRGVMPTLTMPLPTVQPIIHLQSNITSSATGTKTTVINAFGNLPKKSK